MCVCVCVCVCECVRVSESVCVSVRVCVCRSERERKKEKEREREWKTMEVSSHDENFSPGSNTQHETYRSLVKPAPFRRRGPFQPFLREPEQLSDAVGFRLSFRAGPPCSTHGPAIMDRRKRSEHSARSPTCTSTSQFHPKT